MMLNKALLAIVSLALVSASPLSEKATCSSYTLISTRGTEERQGPSAGFEGMIAQTLAAIPGGKEYDTVYPAELDQNSTAGTADIVRKVRSGSSACFILLGYSQGATATVEALRRISGADMDSVKAVLMIGNPEHKAGLACNLDSKGGSTTKNTNGIFVYKGGIPSRWVDRVLDICAKGDGVCDASSAHDLAAAAAAHESYPHDSVVQAMGAQYIQKALLGF